MTLFRAYDPEQGRWLSRDPLENAEASEGPNLYTYVANDPVNLADPLGLSGWAPMNVIWSEKPVMKPVHNFFPRSPQPSRPPPPRPGGNLGPKPPGDLAPRPKGELARRGELALRLKGDLALRPKGELALRPKGELALRPKGELALRQPRATPKPLVERTPRPSVDFGSPGFSGAFSGFLDAGMTILTMTDCNTVNGLLGLVRQGKGGSVNIYQDRMLKELDEIDPVP